MINQKTAALVFLSGVMGFAQESATLTVTVYDATGAVVPGAKLTVTNLQRGLVNQVETNGSGFAVFDFLAPGDYSLDAFKAGFDKYHVDQLTLKIRDRQTLRVELKVLAAAETSVEVTDRVETLSSDVAQGAAADKDYLQNLPVNGRSTESLILMAPGVTTAAGGKGDGGFNANGLRSNTNYYTLDGVSMNRPTGGGPSGGSGPGPGAGPPGGGGPGAASTETISIDAMQEIKVQTSSFAPEFGRSPGAQVVMSSRGGTNDLHGSLYYYGRRGAFDANDWFANAGGYGKTKEQQDRPGGVLGGPVVKNRMFFFVSLDTLHLQSPQTVVADVPDMATRQSASVAIRPYLDVFPIPNGSELGSGAAEYRAVVSNPSRSYSGSIRLDEVLNARTTLFARVSWAQSNSDQRGSDVSTPNVVTYQSSRSQTVTAGATHEFSAHELNDLRVSYSKTSGSGHSTMDNYGGATVLSDALAFPEGVTSATGSFSLNMLGLAGYSYGGHSANSQDQINIVDSLSKVRRSHNLKAGVDYREILQTNNRTPYTVGVSFNGLTDNDQSLLSGDALNAQVASNLTAVYPTYINFSVYGQDTWRATDRTTVTYGLRWDVNPAPTARKGPQPFALADSTIAGVTQNEPIYPTRWLDVAPRFGVAYLSDDKPGHEMTLRAGLGMFYDTGYGVVGSAFGGAPYSAVWTLSEVAFPLSASDLTPPSLPPTRPYGQITTGGTGLSSPVVYQWNGAWEKYYGTGQMLSIAITGTKGSNLMRTETQPSFSGAYSILREVTNGASSLYNGLQIQFRKRLSTTLQTQLSYTWSHSIDSASNDAGFGGGFASLFGSGERGPSDYDVRHSANFSGSWRLPAPAGGAVFYPFRHWYLNFTASARSGLPFDIQGVSTDTSSSSSSSSSTTSGLFAQVRPDYIGNFTGQPLWIKDPHVPGGRRLNKDAFSIPSGYAQGDLGRNALRGFSFGQLDLSVRRMIPITERFRLSLSAQAYNVLNHPNFANPSPFEGGNMSSPNFGVMTRMINQSFGGGDSLYRSGGPRSMELAIRVQF